MYINKKESSTKIGPISSTLQSTESVIRLVRELANDAALFYEMESVEVIEVHNDPTTSFISTSNCSLFRLELS